LRRRFGRKKKKKKAKGKKQKAKGKSGQDAASPRFQILKTAKRS